MGDGDEPLRSFANEDDLLLSTGVAVTCPSGLGPRWSRLLERHRDASPIGNDKSGSRTVLQIPASSLLISGSNLPVRASARPRLPQSPSNMKPAFLLPA